MISMLVRSLKTKARPTTSLFENKVIKELQSLPKLDNNYEHTQTQNNDETGGPKGLEPTRYNDWEQKGRCTDF